MEGGLNTYAYVGGNPTLRIDSKGLAWKPCSGNPGADCWVPSPVVDMKPQCITAECAADLPPAPSDSRSICENEKGQYKFASSISIGVGVGPLVKGMGYGIEGSAAIYMPRTQGLCEWICTDN